jgi:ornithine--oxo-acid transaminase
LIDLKSKNMVENQVLGNLEKKYIDLGNSYTAPNYARLEVVFSHGAGPWLWDIEGRKYLDMLSAYSAVNFGHCNKRLNARAIDQMNKLTMVSAAFYNDVFAEAVKKIAELCAMESVIMMNSGAEAVETAIKTARRWGYLAKGIEENQAEIIVFSGNFHGRTTSIISFSEGKESRRAFGPYTPGFRICPYGDIQSLEALINKNTAAVLIEPIQGEGGVIIPPAGYLKQVRDLCTVSQVLFIADEIQTGLCRTGKVFCCEHESVLPDMYIIAKSLGGGITPVSAVATRREIFSLMGPGSHGSTFGGNLFASAIACEVCDIIKEEKPHEHSAELGQYLLQKMKEIASKSKVIESVRGRGLYIGIDINPQYGAGKDYCKKLLKEGVICKDTREKTIRLAPPLVVSKEELEYGIERLKKVFTADTH